MIKVTIVGGATGNEDAKHTSHTWQMKTPMPKFNTDRIIKIRVNGMELDTVRRDIANVPYALMQPETVSTIKARKLFSPHIWYGDDAKFIWDHFKENYQ